MRDPKKAERHRVKTAMPDKTGNKKQTSSIRLLDKEVSAIVRSERRKRGLIMHVLGLANALREITTGEAGCFRDFPLGRQHAVGGCPFSLIAGLKCATRNTLIFHTPSQAATASELLCTEQLTGDPCEVETPELVALFLHAFDGDKLPEYRTTDKGREIPMVYDWRNVPVDATCQEASMRSVSFYIPCGNTAATIIYHQRERRAYFMCNGCAYHNIKNRGAWLLAISPMVGLLSKELAAKLKDLSTRNQRRA